MYQSEFHRLDGMPNSGPPVLHLWGRLSCILLGNINNNDINVISSGLHEFINIIVDMLSHEVWLNVSTVVVILRPSTVAANNNIYFVNRSRMPSVKFNKINRKTYILKAFQNVTRAVPFPFLSTVEIPVVPCASTWQFYCAYPAWLQSLFHQHLIPCELNVFGSGCS